MNWRKTALDHASGCVATMDNLTVDELITLRDIINDMLTLEIHPSEHNKSRGDGTHKDHRYKVLDILGGKCAHCGIDNYEVLQIDHKIGGGGAERKMRYQKQIWCRIIKLNGAGYQALCANCHMVKSRPESRTSTGNYVGGVQRKKNEINDNDEE